MQSANYLSIDLSVCLSVVQTETVFVRILSAKTLSGLQGKGRQGKQGPHRNRNRNRIRIRIERKGKEIFVIFLKMMGGRLVGLGRGLKTIQVRMRSDVRCQMSETENLQVTQRNAVACPSCRLHCRGPHSHPINIYLTQKLKWVQKSTNSKQLNYSMLILFPALTLISFVTILKISKLYGHHIHTWYVSKQSPFLHKVPRLEVFIPPMIMIKWYNFKLNISSLIK